MFESEKIAMADYILRNDGDSFLVQQVLKVHRSILAR
jgi:hypothetical protein